MEKEIENKVIELYLSGIGSTTIASILSLPKRNILKLLKEKNLIRNRLHSEEFYSNFWEENGKWYGHWICNTCNEKIKFSVNKKCLLYRNLNNKKTCKKCSLDKQIGKGNPFYNKTHTKESINKISLKKIGVKTSDHMSKPEYKKLFSDNAKERWKNGSMEQTRIKLSNLMKERIAKGKIKSYNRSKAEDEILETLKLLNIESIPNFLLEGKIFDIYVPKFNLLIEYNGDYWHCNPLKYLKDYFNHKKQKTAQEIWDYDQNKLDLAKNNGYICEVIWETDYKQNKNVILNLIKTYGEPN